MEFIFIINFTNKNKINYFLINNNNLPIVIIIIQ